MGGLPGLVPDEEDFEQSLTQSITNFHLSAAGQKHYATRNRADESEQSHEFGVLSKMGSSLCGEPPDIEEDDQDGTDEGGGISFSMWVGLLDSKS